MTHQDLLKDLKAKQYKPVYLLHGEEGFFIDKITNHFENKVLSEGEKAFNYTVIYGKEANARTIIDTASRYPMMAPYQLLILKEAQEMRTLKDLKAYVEKAVPSTILVICHKHKRLDMRSAFGKAIKKHGVVYESKKLYDNQVPEWIDTYLASKKLQITPNATALIAEYLGTNLSKVANELDKLAINQPAGSTISDKIVQDNIGISKDYNVFELQNALGARDTPKCFRIINYFISNPRKNPMVVLVATLYNFFSKVYMTYALKNLRDGELAKTLGFNPRNDYAAAFMVKKYKIAVRNYSLAQTQTIIGILKDYDLRAKGVNNVNAPEGELMKELVYNILDAK